MIPGHRVAQAGVTDFKAAIRYVRYNRDLLPGDMDSVFTLSPPFGKGRQVAPPPFVIHQLRKSASSS